MSMYETIKNMYVCRLSHECTCMRQSCTCMYMYGVMLAKRHHQCVCVALRQGGAARRVPREDRTTRQTQRPVPDPGGAG